MSQLMQVVSGSGEELAALVAIDTAPSAAPAARDTAPPPAAPAVADAGGYLAPWIETVNCTACDECTEIRRELRGSGILLRNEALDEYNRRTT